MQNTNIEAINQENPEKLREMAIAAYKGVIELEPKFDEALTLLRAYPNPCPALASQIAQVEKSCAERAEYERLLGDALASPVLVLSPVGVQNVALWVVLAATTITVASIVLSAKMQGTEFPDAQ